MKAAVCSLHGRNGHIAGRELLRRLYEMETKEPMPPIALGHWGKPYFINSPYCFSISHTHRHAFCVLARQNVAIDAEELDRRVMLRLAPRILSAEELRQFRTAEDQQRAFLTFWVLKEAGVKLSGEGLQGFPNNTQYSLDDPRVREWEGCLTAIFSDGEEGIDYYAF